jgi:hypothetical protein
MLNWLKRLGTPARIRKDADVEAAPKASPPGRAMSGKYRLLYKYLKNRYADTVVLTFAQIEDLLGFALPEQARLRCEWWTEAEAHLAGSDYSESWILASRTAVPNLMARIVVFERAS